MIARLGTLGSADVEVRAPLKPLERDLDKARQTTDRASTRMSQSFSKVATKAAAAAAAVLAIRGAMGGIDNAITKLDAIGKTADRIGLTTDALQELRFAAERSGVEVQNLDVALRSFAVRVGEVRAGTGEAKEIFKQLGIELTNTDGSLRSNEQLLNDVADALAKTEDPARRLLIATKLFGEEGAALVTMLGNGKAGLDDLREAARRANAVIGEDSVRAAADARDAIDTLSTAFSSTFVSAVGAAAKALVEFFRIGQQGKVAGIRAELEDVNGEMRILDKLAGEYEDTIRKFESAGELSKTDAISKRIAEKLLAKTRQDRLNLMTERDIIQSRLDSALGPQGITVDPTASKTPGTGSGGGGGGGGKSGPRDIGPEILERLKERIDLLKQERSEIGLTTEETTRLRAAFDRERIERELIAAAQRDGVVISAEVIAQAKEHAAEIEDLTIALAKEREELRRNNEEKDRAAERNDRMIQDLQSISDTMIYAIESSNGFTDALKRIGYEVGKLAVLGLFGQGAAGGLFNNLFGVQQGGILGAALPSFGNPVASHMGNVFRGGRIIPHAKGGIINSPVVFPMANGIGSAAEKRAEAIMPLAFGPDGHLGVRATGQQPIERNTYIFEGVNGATQAQLRQMIQESEARMSSRAPRNVSAGWKSDPSLRR